MEEAHSDNGLSHTIRQLYDTFGQRKLMSTLPLSQDRPHYFLLRRFWGEVDLLLILNTRRCRYQCAFCQLPARSSTEWIDDRALFNQFVYAATEIKHSLSLVDRVTISNEGSVLDTSTISTPALLGLARLIRELRLVRTIVLETRLEFVRASILDRFREEAEHASIEILTGFETLDEAIRSEVLRKREPLRSFLQGLDQVAESGASLTAYVLYKPSPTMSDDQAMHEAERSIDFVVEQCRLRRVRLSGIRLNPMYRANGSEWARNADTTLSYAPPRLTDVMKLAEKKKSEGIRMYIGLSTEELASRDGTYLAREDYTPHLVRPIKEFNDEKLSVFPWEQIILGTSS